MYKLQITWIFCNWITWIFGGTLAYAKVPPPTPPSLCNRWNVLSKFADVAKNVSL